MSAAAATDGSTAPGAPLRIAVSGAQGRMGAAVCRALEDCDDLALVARLDSGSDAAAEFSRTAPDVLVDFTIAAASRRLGPLAASLGIAPVIGTSGLTDDDQRALRDACRQGEVGGLVVPNFSVGAVLQMRFAEEAARWLACDEVREVHHTGKRDSPSGTARATARRVARAADSRLGGSAATGDGREDAAIVIPILSERRDGLVARQDVHFSAPGEWLQLVHQVDDRSAYLPGVLLAVRRVGQLDGLHLGLEAVLGRP